MSKKANAVAIAFLMGSIPTALAQTHRDGVAVRSESIQSDEMRSGKIIGRRVYDHQNRNIGKVSDVIRRRDATVDVVIVDVGRFLGMGGGKDVAVKPNDIKADNNRLTLDVTKEQLEQMPKYSMR